MGKVTRRRLLGVSVGTVASWLVGVQAVGKPPRAVGKPRTGVYNDAYADLY